MKWKFCTKPPYFPPKTTTKLAGNWKTTTLVLSVRGSLATTVTDMWPCPETESSQQSFIQVVYDAGQTKDTASDLTCVQRMLWLDWPKMCILWSLVSAASTLLTDTHHHSESATSDDDHCLYSTILHSQADSRCLHVILLDHDALCPQKRGCLLGTGTGGGRGWESEGSTADTTWKRPWTAARTMEVLRWCPLAIAQQLVHCAIAVSTAMLGSHKDNVHCTAVEEQPEAKEVQLSQPSSTSLLMISSGITWGSSSTSLLLISSGTLSMWFYMSD